MNKYIVRDEYSGYIVFIGSVKQITEHYKVGESTVRSAIARGTKLYGRYSLSML